MSTGSISERATATRPKRAERPQPKYIARAKVGNGWVSIGAAWAVRSGEDALSVQLQTMPIGFDGRFVLLPPLPNGEAGDPPPED